jgi:hypothetical protein
MLSVAHLCHLERDLIRVIASLPKLTSLSLALPAGIVLDYTCVESGFQSLTRVELSGSTFEIHNFLAVIKPKVLSDLTIYPLVTD